MSRRTESGQALVETALVLPVILAMVLGIFGFGRLFNAQLVITNASREGARVGALGRADDGIKQSVNKYLTGAGLTERVAISIDRPPSPDGPDVHVAIRYPFHTGIALPGVPDPLYLTSSAEMRMENQ
jgi:hypothetical protein